MSRKLARLVQVYDVAHTGDSHTDMAQQMVEVLLRVDHKKTNLDVAQACRDLRSRHEGVLVNGCRSSEVVGADLDNHVVACNRWADNMEVH
jgi:hypothetical protein